MNDVIEVVRFTVHPEERGAFLAEREAAIAALAGRFDGLLAAELAEFPDGDWIDVVRWRSQEAAEAAAAGALELEPMRTWSSHIAEVVDFRHATVHHRFRAAAH